MNIKSNFLQIPSYSTTTQRDNSITNPEEGMLCITNGKLTYYYNDGWLDLTGTSN